LKKRDETVDVGASLYELDTEGAASAASSEVDERIHVETTAEIISTSNQPPSSDIVLGEPTLYHREPSIHFLGKDGWAKLKSKSLIPEKASPPSIPTATKSILGLSSPHAISVIYEDIHPLYGRPIFTDVEIEALIMGFEGEPDVVRHSTGAKFKM
jgi:hypothetical protein